MGKSILKKSNITYDDIWEEISPSLMDKNGHTHVLIFTYGKPDDFPTYSITSKYVSAVLELLESHNYEIIDVKFASHNGKSVMAIYK